MTTSYPGSPADPTPHGPGDAPASPAAHAHPAGRTADVPSPRRPPAARPILWRIISLVVALLVTPVAVAMILAGARLHQIEVQTALQPSASGLVLVIVGSALIGAVACTAFWSSMGVAVEGALILFFGLVAFFLPYPTFTELVAPVDALVGGGLLVWALYGTPLILGGLFVVVGGVASVARRRTTRGPAVPLVR